MKISCPIIETEINRKAWPELSAHAERVMEELAKLEWPGGISLLIMPSFRGVSVHMTYPKGDPPVLFRVQIGDVEMPSDGEPSINHRFVARVCFEAGRLFLKNDK